jgi:hypothetical protein
VVVKTRAVEYRTCEITIPRCQACKNKSTQSMLIGIAGLLACCGVAYLVISSAFNLPVWLVGWPSYIIAAVAGFVLWNLAIIASLFIREKKPLAPSSSDFYGYYPPLWQLVQQGWHMGERPPRDV